MKKQYLLLLMTITFFAAKAQNTFAPIGAEWWYSSSDGLGSQGVHFLLNVSVSHDTLVDGAVCQVIEQRGIIKTSSAFSWPPPIQ